MKIIAVISQQKKNRNERKRERARDESKCKRDGHARTPHFLIMKRETYVRKMLDAVIYSVLHSRIYTIAHDTRAHVCAMYTYDACDAK